MNDDADLALVSLKQDLTDELDDCRYQILDKVSVSIGTVRRATELAAWIEALDSLLATRARIAELERERVNHGETIVRVLQEIFRNDATHYEHHQPRRWDGSEPRVVGGTIWLTPREMARGLLGMLDAEVPDSIAEMRAKAKP